MSNIFLNYNRGKFLIFIIKKKKEGMHNLRALKRVFIYIYIYIYHFFNVLFCLLFFVLIL